MGKSHECVLAGVAHRQPLIRLSAPIRALIFCFYAGNYALRFHGHKVCRGLSHGNYLPAPSVIFAMTHKELPAIERLLRSIELANRETRMRWMIELALQQTVVFILRPRFYKQPREVTSGEIEDARRDLGTLGRCLRRDVGLSWWRD